MAVSITQTKNFTGSSTTMTLSGTATHLVVGIASQSNGFPPVRLVSGVTYNGISMTQQAAMDNTVDGSISMWVLANPTTGSSQTIQVSGGYVGGGGAILTAWEIAGGNPSAASYPSNNINSSLATSLTTSVTETVANGILFNVFMVSATPTLSATNGETIDQQNTFSAFYRGATAHKILTTIGAYTTGYSFTGGAACALGAVIIQAAPPAPTANGAFLLTMI